MSSEKRTRQVLDGLAEDWDESNIRQVEKDHGPRGKPERGGRGMPNAIVEPVEQVVRVNGRLAVAANIAMSPEQFQEYREGRRCLKCHGKQSEAMPAVCETRDLSGSWRCGFRIRDDQLRFLEHEFRGEQQYGPTSDDLDVEREAWSPRTGIWLPNTYKEKH